MSEVKWKKVNSLPNLHVLSINGVERGFVYKPYDNPTDKNAWRCHWGIGHSNKFLGHEWTKDLAYKAVESVAGLHQTR